MKFNPYISFGLSTYDTTPEAEDDKGVVEIHTVTLDGKFTLEELEQIITMFKGGKS